MKWPLPMVILSLLSTSCEQRVYVETPVTEEDVRTEKSTETPSVPILPLFCPTREEMADDPTFGKHRSPNCSARRPSFLIDRLEPSLETGVPEDVTAFRLYVQRSWGQDTLVRLQKIGDKIELIEKGGFPHQDKQRNTWLEPRVTKVSSQNWNGWVKIFHNSGYWETEKWDIIDIASQADGSTWKLEATQNGRYHNVKRTERPVNQEFLNLCQALLETRGH